MLHRMKDLQRGPVLAQDGELGSVDDAVFDEARWGVRYFVIGTGRWWPGSRKLLVRPEALEPAVPDQRGRERIRILLTREQIERTPASEERLAPLRSSAALIGCSVEAPDGAIGHVDDVVVDGSNWQIADMVVDTGHSLQVGLRIGLPGGRRVLVPPSAVARLDLSERKVHVRLSRDEVRNSPEA